jgi:hypothetical protein
LSGAYRQHGGTKHQGGDWIPQAHGACFLIHLNEGQGGCCGYKPYGYVVGELIQIDPVIIVHYELIIHITSIIYKFILKG